jgi:hypothetical protein
MDGVDGQSRVLTNDVGLGRPARHEIEDEIHRQPRALHHRLAGHDRGIRGDVISPAHVTHQRAR